MKPALIYLLLSFIAPSIIAQNVGIGTSAPAEKLDVNGNVNINGKLKISNNEGNLGEILMSGGSGQNPVWAGLNFTNVQRFNASSNPQSFTIPSGVTKIMMEGWSSGGYPFVSESADKYSGGSGGYIRGIVNVIPGSVITIKVPQPQNSALLPDTLKLDYNGSRLWLANADSSRGGFLISKTTLFFDILNVDGEDGEALFISYFQNSASQFVKDFQFPKGGNAPFGGNGGGGQKVMQIITPNDYYFIGKAKRAAFPGGGGYYKFSFTNAPVYTSSQGAAGVLYIYY